MEVQLPSPSFPLCCDRVRLIQVLSNLAGNALKFTPAGGSVTVRVAREAEQAIITVRDTGRGIAPDELPHVFDRYWRARSSERATRGVGLGLAIVKGIVEGHGGTIQAESTLGQGSTFTLRLPLAEPSCASASAVQAAASAGPRGLQR
jgi:signal transduction histidine kinase